jgi:hypothetical protein
MPGRDGSEENPTTVMIGPAALAGVVLAVRAIRRRSFASAVCAVGLLGVEAGCRPYRRLLGEGALRFSRPESPDGDLDVEQPGV